MAGFVQNILWNSVSGFVEAGTRSAGEFAGNALIKAGDLVENGGRSVGTGKSSFLPSPSPSSLPLLYKPTQKSTYLQRHTGIEKKATGYGTAITGQTYQTSAKALPSTARKPVAKRSNSLPASSTAGPRPVSKYPGANQVGGAKKAATGGAKSTVGGVTGGVVGGVGHARNTVGGVAGGANRALGGVTGNATKTIGGVTGGANKALGGVTGGVVGGGQKALGGVTGNANRALGGVTGNANSALGGVTGGANRAIGGVVGGGQKALGGATSTLSGASKPSYPTSATRSNSLPKPYNPNAYPSSAPKTGYTPPAALKKAAGAAQKAYPGTNAVPGAVQNQTQRLKPLPRMGAQVAQGQEMKSFF
jgi:hypothetical protein